MKDAAAIVTEKIIALLAEGTIPWHHPWCCVREGAFNRVTGKSYSLLNQLLLTHDGEYATYAQIQKLGGHVRKGEHGEQVVFFDWSKERPGQEALSPMTEDTSDDGAKKAQPKQQEAQPTNRRYPILRLYTVFHVKTQVEGLAPLPETPLKRGACRIGAAEALLGGYIRREGITLEECPSNQAFYAPAADRIHIPSIGQYQDPGLYYSVLAHEAVHSTGHAKRLARPGVMEARFGEAAYSREELVAEIGAAALLHEAGIGSDLTLRSSAAYIDGWLKALRSDKRMIIAAAGQAQRAAQMITADDRAR